MNEKYLTDHPVSPHDFEIVQEIGRHGGRFEKKKQTATSEVRA